MMSLNTDILEAIKNKTYHLRPVQEEPLESEMRSQSRTQSLDMSLGHILARRVAMGYGLQGEEDARSVASLRYRGWRN